MNKKTIILSTVLILITAAFCFGYYKYNRYLPTLNESPAQVLSSEGIQKIRAEHPITIVKVYKSKRILELLHQDQIMKRYDMRLGFDPIGHKVKEGDGKTPEGRYIIDWRNPNSQFYKSLHISYPNEEDKKKAQTLGVSPGGDIMIHGSANNAQIKKLPKLMEYLPRNDWTWGCVAVRNIDMDEIWKLVDNGTPIEIYP